MIVTDEDIYGLTRTARSRNRVLRSFKSAVYACVNVVRPLRVSREEAAVLEYRKGVLLCVGISRGNGSVGSFHVLCEGEYGLGAARTHLRKTHFAVSGRKLVGRHRTLIRGVDIYREILALCVLFSG